nr:helix-turn-helix transcriptional regulator [Bittarella massiliensis (ex Durand et al. 2017)]
MIFLDYLSEVKLVAVKYDKLFHLLIDRKITNAQLAQKAGVSANIITRLKRDQYISLESIERLCVALNCGVDDILEFTK